MAISGGRRPADQRMRETRTPMSGIRSSAPAPAPPTQTHLGARLKGVREAAGLTQDDLGRRVNSSRFAIGRIEDSADPRISLRQLQKISEVLRAPVADLIGPTSEGEDPVNRRQLLQVTGATALAVVTTRSLISAVETADIAEISTAIEDLRHLDQIVGGKQLLYFADRLVTDTERLLTGRLSSQEGLRLQIVHGKAAVLAGWLSEDSGRLQAAGQHYSTAMTAAQLAADPALTVEAAHAMAFLAIKRREPTRAIQCVQAASRAALASRSGPRTRALLAAREAIARGQQGDVAGTDAAVLRTWRALESGRGTDEPWADFVSEAELTAMIGQAYSNVGRIELSVRHLETALEQFDASGRPRNAASWRGYLGITQAKAGDLGQAAHIATSLLPTAQSLKSAGLRSDIRTINGLLRAHRQIPEVRHFSEQADAAGLA